MERGDVSSFVEHAEEAIATAPGMGLRNTQLRVVEPFLSMLGWDVRSAAVEAAYESANGTVLEYALCPGDHPGAYVAVRACSDPLDDAGRDELLAAMRASNVGRGVYTNGRTYLLVALASEPGSTDASVEQVELELTDLPEHAQALESLALETVAALQQGSRRRAAASLVAASETAVESVTAAVVDAAAEDVSDVVEPLTRRFLDEVVDELAPGADAEALGPADDVATDVASSPGQSSTEDQATESATEQAAESATGQAAESATEQAAESAAASVSTLAARGESNASSDSDAASGSDSEFVLRFFEDGRSVGAVGNSDARNAVAQAVRYLLEERGLGPRLEYPYVPEDETSAFVHREPMHPDGSAMSAAIDLGGLYVCIGDELPALQARVETLAGRLGLAVMYTGDWSAGD